MDWSNLLSGTIGALIGTVGVLASTAFTVRRSSEQDAERAKVAAADAAAQAWRENAVRVSGELADKLVRFYEDQRLLLLPEHSPDSMIDVSTLRESASDLRRAITVDGPVLTPALEDKMRAVRKEIRRIIDRDTTLAAASDLDHLLAEVRDAGDELRDLRREEYGGAPRGARLGETSKS